MIDCCCSANDGPGPEFLRESYPKAKKNYKCCECGETIKKGDIYEYVVGAWPDGFDTYRTCIICSKIRKDLFCSWTYGWLSIELWDCYYLEL